MANSTSRSNWYGHYFTSRPIATLSLQFHSTDGNTDSSSSSYSVGYARSGDEAECREIVLEAKATGDNVGEGEFNEQHDFLILLRISEVFVVRKYNSASLDAPNCGKDENKIEAVLVIQPSLLARTFDNCLAHIHIFRRKELKQNSPFYLQLLRASVALSRSLEVGYTRCIARVSASLLDLVKLYRQEGFLVVASIEEGVKLVGLGSTVDLILVNNLGVPQRPRRPAAEILEIVDLTYRHYKEELHEEMEMLPVLFLPQAYVFSSGFKVTLREMKKSDWEWAYLLWTKSASKGQGYGIDECPTFEVFRDLTLVDHYGVVLEEWNTSYPVGYTIITDSWYTRNPDTHLGESSIFIDEEFRGRNLGRESTILELALMKELGYKGSLNDLLLSNARMGHVLRSSSVPPISVGTIPDGTYTAGYGWDDQVLTYADLKQVPTFSQMAKESLARKVTSSVSNASKL